MTKTFFLALLSLMLGSMNLAAQTSAPDPVEPAELRLVLVAKNMVDGLPRDFSFILTNVSNVELRLPQPVIECNNYPEKGVIQLDQSWMSDSGGQQTGRRKCDGSTLLDPDVLRRAKTWNLLRPGDSVTIEMDDPHLLMDSSRSGSYTFSATYIPPFFPPDDRTSLARRGFRIPVHKVQSDKLVYNK